MHHFVTIGTREIEVTLIEEIRVDFPRVQIHGKAIIREGVERVWLVSPKRSSGASDPVAVDMTPKEARKEPRAAWTYDESHNSANPDGTNWSRENGFTVRATDRAKLRVRRDEVWTVKESDIRFESNKAYKRRTELARFNRVAKAWHTFPDAPKAEKTSKRSKPVGPKSADKCRVCGTDHTSGKCTIAAIGSTE